MSSSCTMLSLLYSPSLPQGPWSTLSVLWYLRFLVKSVWTCLFHSKGLEQRINTNNENVEWLLIWLILLSCYCCAVKSDAYPPYSHSLDVLCTATNMGWNADLFLSLSSLYFCKSVQLHWLLTRLSTLRFLVMRLMYIVKINVVAF